MIVILGFWFLCAIATSMIAAKKGRSGFGWFLIGLIFGVFGILFALIGSDRTKEIVAANTSATQAAQLAESRKCPYCAEQIKREAIVCRYCGRDLPAAAVDEAETRFSAWLAEQNPPLCNLTGVDRESYRQAWESHVRARM